MLKQADEKNIRKEVLSELAGLAPEMKQKSIRYFFYNPINSAVNRILSEGEEVSAGRVREELEKNDPGFTATESSLESIEAVFYLFSSMSEDEKEGIKCVYVYGSAPRGEADAFEHYTEECLFKGGEYVKSVFKREPGLKSDVDFAVVVEKHDGFQDRLREHICRAREKYPGVCFVAKILPEKQLLEHLKQEGVVKPRKILLYNQKVCVLGYDYLGWLKEKAIEFSGAEHGLEENFEFNEETDFKSIRMLQVILGEKGVEEFELSAEEMKELYPIEYAIRIHETNNGTSSNYSKKVDVPPHPKLRCEKEC